MAGKTKLQSKKTGASKKKFVFGALIAAILITVTGGFLFFANKPSSGFSVKPGSGPEGTEITVTTKKPDKTFTKPVSVEFTDPAQHGFHIVHGAGLYVTFDPTKGLKYKSDTEEETKEGKETFTAVVPYGICGLIIVSSQATPPPPKVLTVQLVDANGKVLPGSGSFKLKCDKYTLKFKMSASPKQVLADGKDTSTVNAVLTVKGPVYEVIGQKISRPKTPIIQETPLGNVMVHFTTDLGLLAPNPANVITDLSGTATVTTTSNDAGIAKIIGQATGIGDSFVNVHFMPKIVGVTETFVEPNSPTNFELSVIPTDSSKLNFSWNLIYPGAQCGSMTGQAQGMGLTKNGYFHGPTQGFPNGCDPTNYEAFVKVQVTVTDKDGGTDSQTFPARAYEGMGLFKFPVTP